MGKAALAADGVPGSRSLVLKFNALSTHNSDLDYGASGEQA